MNTVFPKEKLKSFSDKLYMRRNSLRIFENRLRVNIICAIVFLIITLIIPFLLGDFLSNAAFFYPVALIGWTVYTVTTLKGITMNLNKIISEASDGELKYRAYRKLKKSGALKEFEVQESTVSAQDTESEGVEPVEDTEEQKVARAKVKKAAITNIWLEIGKKLPLFLALILILIPLINVNLIIADYNTGIIDFVVATGDAEELEKSVNAELMEDFFKLPDGGYKHFFSSWGKDPMSYVPDGAVDSFNDVVALVWGFFSNTFLPVLSIVVILIFSIIGLFGLPIAIYRLCTARGSINTLPGDAFDILFNDNLRSPKTKAKLGMSLFYLFLKYFLGVLLAFAAYSFLPARLIVYLASDPLITVSPLLTIGLPILVGVSFIFYVIEFWHSVKKALLLSIYESI